MQIWLWIGFLALIMGLLALDLGVFHRRAHAVGFREALRWVALWVSLGLSFTIVVYFFYEYDIGLEEGAARATTGAQAALLYLTGYLIEQSLSVDNIVVIALIFSSFGVPAAYQHRVLFWGIAGAVVMRGAMILGGVALIHRFEWIIYVFGALLLASALKLLLSRPEEFDPDRSWIVRAARRVFPISADYEGQRFFTRVHGRLMMTPMFLVLLVVEAADVMFAVDSIPAIFAVTRDPFIIFTSNVFAILGLRSLYFVLASVVDRFRYLTISLVVLLAFVGVKMLLSHTYPIPAPVSLAVILTILSIGFGASLIAHRRQQRAERLRDPQVASEARHG